MEHRSIVAAGGACFIIGALAFVSVFSYLAAHFDYPGILDGSAAEVLPRLRAGGSAMRAIWAIYAFLPLLLVPGAVGAYFACPSSRGRMTLALVAAAFGALAMCLGLMRWPSMHWALADAFADAGPDARASLSAVFRGLNLYLGNYIGEFLGEARFPKWLGWGGVFFAILFLAGAFRNALPAVQEIADANNLLLPLWMIVLGASLIWQSRKT